MKKSKPDKRSTKESNLVTLPLILEKAIPEVKPSYRLIFFSRREASFSLMNK